MRSYILAATAALALAGPAFAGTVDEVVKHGIILTVQDMQIEVTYTPDGKLSALDGQVTGTWRIDGDKLCTTWNFEPNETCVAYPKDKKSGDSFEITGAQGPVTIKIK